MKAPRQSISKAILLVGLSIGLWGCGAPAVSLKTIETEVWGKSCAFTSCHKGTGAGGLNLEGATWSRLVDVAAVQQPTMKLVTAGQPEKSYLFEKLSKAMPSVGTRMPPEQALDAARLESVRAWIAAGAPNN